MSAGAALTFAILIALERKRILPENGLFYVQIAMFCALRFAVEFVRAGDVTAAGLTLAQLGCIAGITYALWKLRPLLGRPIAVPA
jgi:prolipoprotein diacylglyceryltransferase